MKWARAIGLAFMPAAVMAVASTDSLQDVDPSQSGYMPGHNMDPTQLSNFTLGWKNIYNVNEKFYAKPLVWTPPGSTSEVLIVVSNQNIIRMIDGASGSLLKTRTLDPPFKQEDSNCGDIPNTIGITSTPWIDGATNIMYVVSKGYKGGLTGSGTINGQYKMYGINLLTLADVIPPVSLEGKYADNDHTRYFVGGTLAQRPSLASIGDSIIAAFGGHCDSFNYTGMIVAISKTANVGVTSVMAMEVSPGAPSPQALDIMVEGGGKAGIWQSGMGLAIDGNNIYFVTGNGRGGGDNAGGKPADGKKGQSTLQNAAVSLTLVNGVFKFRDYFEPYEYQSLNGGDRDFGASGAALLDPFFSGGGINRLVVSGGKSGKIYIMDADNLGGFAMGSGGLDNVVQIIKQPNSLLGGIASYPAEGGYIYFAPSGNPADNLHAYKFGKDSSGKPLFTWAGKTSIGFAGRAVPSVTSLNGVPGTGIVWVADVNNGLLAFKAVPENGVLVPITLPYTGRLQKMQRPGFGNSRAYTVSSNYVIMVGPATVPAVGSLTCTPAPLAFGSVAVGQTSTLQVTCKAAGTAYTLKGCTTGLATFQCSGVPPTVPAGGQFTFPVVFNVTNDNIEASRLAGFRVVPGVEGAAINIISSTGATITSIQGTATVVASGGFLVAGNSQLDFGAVTVGSTSAVQTITLANNGASALAFAKFAYQDLKLASPQSFVAVTPDNSTTIGNGFAATGFPNVNAQLAPGAVITLSVTYKPTVAGSSSSLITFYSDGGNVDVMLIGAASQSSITSAAVVSTLSLAASSSVPLSSSKGASSSVSQLISSSVLSSSAAVSSAVSSSPSNTVSSSALPSSIAASSITLSLSSAIIKSSQSASSSVLQASSSSSAFDSTSARVLSSSSVVSASSSNSQSLVVPTSTSAASISSTGSSGTTSTTALDTASTARVTSSIPASTSVLSSVTTTTTTSEVPSATPAKIFPPGAIIIPIVPGQPAVYAAPAGNFTDDLGNGGPLAGFVGYNMTVQMISPPEELTGIYECLGNCSSTAFGGPYTMAGVEDTDCFCANGTSTDTATPGRRLVRRRSYVNGKIASRKARGPIYIYKIAPVASLPNAPVPSVQASSTIKTTSSSSSALSRSSTIATTIKPLTTSSVPVTTLRTSTIPASPSKSSTLSLATATPAPSTNYPYVGCFSDTTTSHALPLLFKSTAMTPQLCESYVLSLAAKPTPTVLPYYFMEFASECYGGSVFNFGTSATVRSLTGKNACTKVCSGSVGAVQTGMAKCGGSKQFDLYAASGVVDFKGLPIVTTTK